jgi:hypothetical protein
MYPSQDARELSALLRICRDLDVVGDVTATVDSPSELLAWASVLSDARIVGWRANDSGHRYLQVTAERRSAPVRGQLTAVLPCEQHREYWRTLGLEDLEPNGTRDLELSALTDAWSVMPITPGEAASPTAPPSG